MPGLFVFSGKNLADFLYLFQKLRFRISHLLLERVRFEPMKKTTLKAMLHEAIFLARKNSRVTPHFATAIVALRVARKVERPSTFRNIARQVPCV